MYTITLANVPNEASLWVLLSNANISLLPVVAGLMCAVLLYALLYVVSQYFTLRLERTGDVPSCTKQHLFMVKETLMLTVSIVAGVSVAWMGYL